MAGKSLYILKKRPLQPRSEVWLRNITVFVMLAFYITFFIVPIGMAFVGSFHEWNPMNGKYNLIGLDNYQALFKNDLFWSAALNTVIFCAVVVFFRALLGFTCAYAIYSKFVKGKNFFMTMYYMPVIAPLVAVTFVWKFMYEPKVGLINTLLGLSINWLKNKNTALLAVMIMTIWKDFGYAVVLYMAGLMGLSEDVLEAARVDGCTGWQLLKSIVLPLLRPTTLLIIVASIISYLQAYVQVLVLTEGGPGTSTYLTSYLIYNEAFVKYAFGSASAMSFILFVFTALATVVSFKIQAGREA